jgi:hypothetical protein
MALAVIGVALFYRDNLIDAVQRIKPVWVWAGFGFYLLNYGFRALRITSLTKGKLPVWPQAAHCAALHGFTTYMLPLRSGELTLPLILKSSSGMEIKTGLVVLLQARLLDVITIGGWLLVAVVFWSEVLRAPLSGLLGVMGTLMLLSPLILKGLSSWAASFEGLPRRFGVSVLSIGMPGLEGIAWSICIWGALAGCFFCITRAIGISVGFGTIWLLIAIQLPLQLIPFQGLANAGNHEGGWVATLMLVGIAAEPALDAALLSHAVLMLYVLGIGTLALISAPFARPPETEA